MSKFVFYDKLTGAVTKVVECNVADAILNKDADSEAFIEVGIDWDGDDETYYVNDSGFLSKKVKAILPPSIQLKVGEVKVLSLPEPFSITIEGDGGGTYEVPDNNIELEFDVPGEYLLRFSLPHYIVNEVTVNVLEG